MVGLSAYAVNKWKNNRSHADPDNDYDYVMERGSEVRGASDPVEMKVNEAYGTHGQDIDDGQANDTSGLETVDEGAYYEELS